MGDLTPNSLNRLEFWHKDHFGSLSATTDHSGAVTARCAYDPFGNIVADFSSAQHAGTDGGFTEHEHLDDVGIIHMNGSPVVASKSRCLAPCKSTIQSL